MGKILYLDGIRGIAALNVLFTHFIVAFYPAMYNGNTDQVHGGIWEAELAQSVWTLFYAGNLAVPMLFILSAYVLSFRFFMYQDTAIATASAYRRYLRLEIPVVLSMIFSWALMKFGLNYNGEVAQITHSQWFLGSYFQYEPSLWGAIKQGLWECFAVGGDVSYNPVLWTMNFEMLGSFSVFGFLALFGKSKRRYVVYAVMAVVFIKSYYLAFVFGMILSDMHYSAWGKAAREYLLKNQWMTWLFMVVGCVFALYFDDGRNGISRMLNLEFLRNWGVDFHAFYHIIGAAFVLLGCLYNTRIQRILSGGTWQFLGRIAFSLYLVHFLLICSLGSFLFLEIYQAGLSYGVSVFLSAAMTTVFILAAAYLMTKYVDEPAMKMVKKLQKRYFF